MKILVTGANGLLGHDVVRQLTKDGHLTIGIDIAQVDITDTGAITRYIAGTQPDAVIHCAAYTAVDAAEDDQENCYNVNVFGTGNIAEICRKIDTKLMYISTDYVFNGQGMLPWREDSNTEPINVYGATKLGGEIAVIKMVKKHYILRISWVFGLHGKNFVNTMIKLGRERDCVSVASDQVGSPTYTRDLAVLISSIVTTDKYGVYHATNEGYCSWYEFAVEIFKQTKIAVRVNEVESSLFTTKAKRPLNSRMDKSGLDINGFDRLPLWQDALRRYLHELDE